MDKTNRNIMAAFWGWLGNEQNRKILAWIGSGLVVVVSGLWVAFQSPGSKPSNSSAKVPSSSSVSASDGSIAAGGSITIQGDFKSGGQSTTTEHTPE